MACVASGAGENGLADKSLQTLSGIREPLMFVEDSSTDNPAYAVDRVGTEVVDERDRSGLERDQVSRSHLVLFYEVTLKNIIESSKAITRILGRK